ncbi:MAG: aconitate hydratase AcnA [Oceanococcus sp.]
MTDSFGARAQLNVGAKSYDYYRLGAVASDAQLARLPYSLKVLLENLVRNEDGVNITMDDISAVVNWDAKAEPSKEIAFTPARVILQDFTGVPCVVDLAAMRDALSKLGGDPTKINPQVPVELVIDHSVMVDHSGSDNAPDLNAKIEFQRNKERYAFLRWGQTAFDNFKVVPPDTGIVHQVNIEYLSRVVFGQETGVAYPDTVVGTDSHTTMVNGIGVLGWGVGGIEAEAAMLGQAVTMLIPQVVGYRLTGKLSEGVTATDLVLTIVEHLRELGVVGKFVEFFGEGLAELPLADRATIANMAPEYGATCGIFPVDRATMDYLELTGRDEEELALVETYAKENGFWRLDGAADADYSHVLELDLATVQTSLSGPKRPQDRILLGDMKSAYVKSHDAMAGNTQQKSVPVKDFDMIDGNVVVAAITSCTNTSNPAVLIGAGILARNAIAKGLKAKPWVKTSLAPGSQVVTDYLEKANLMNDLKGLGFHVVGYGCTTCIGNTGPLDPAISSAIQEHDLIATAVLSGNRNFEGRIHSDVKMNYLASPPLVVAYAIAGNVNTDLTNDALGQDADGNDVYLKDIWPTNAEITATMKSSLNSEMFKKRYADVYAGDARWQGLEIPKGKIYEWNDDSTYVQNPPFFEGMSIETGGISEIKGARCLAKLGDSITTDHISPAGVIKPDMDAGQYLAEKGVQQADFNSLGSRRGNHEVMMRGTFANVRLRNQIAPGTEGGWTRHQPSGDEMSIYAAAMKYKAANTPLVVLGGKEYGTGSSRDWAAKGTILLGVKAVITESFERIHRSNLVGMGVLPLQFPDGQSHESLGLTGLETYDIQGLSNGAKTVTVTATAEDGLEKSFVAKVRIDTPKEWDYYENGGILQYVIRQLAAA